MIQLDIIKKLNTFFANVETIETVLLIGSFGRGNPKPNSDIDYQIIVTKNFDNSLFVKTLKKELQDELKYMLFLSEKNKWCFYFSEFYIITEIFVCYSNTEIDKYFLGSEIKFPEKTIILDKSNSILEYLNKITLLKQKTFDNDFNYKINYLITEFQNRFEACSYNHFKSDGYKFNVLYSHALNAVVRLIYLCEGNTEHDYMPNNFLTSISYKQNLEIEKLGTMDLRQANWHKRKLLDLFVKYLEIANSKFKLQLQTNGIINFLENIYKRDFFWNFRDISKFNQKIKNGFVFRSSALSLIKEENVLIDMLQKHNIKTIIDLRADREIEENSYSENVKSKFNIVHAPFDPWNQSIEFKNLYNSGTNVEIAYKFFALDCKLSVKKTIETIIANSENSICIHCFAGKDRTGFVITLFHLLSNANLQSIYNDYLASKMDVDLKHLQILLEIIEQEGGIDNYLHSCLLTENQISSLKKLLQNE